MQLYPECAQPELVQWLQSVGIYPVAWGPLGRMGNPVFKKEGFSFSCHEHPYILELAKKHGKSVTQVILAWGMARGCCVIPKASSTENQLSNLGSLDIKLTEEETNEITK